MEGGGVGKASEAIIYESKNGSLEVLSGLIIYKQGSICESYWNYLEKDVTSQAVSQNTKEQVGGFLASAAL